MLKKQANFWHGKALDAMTRAEWESLCCGCGRCCVLKYEDPDTLVVDYTKWACRFLNLETCRCGCYRTRKKTIPECVDLFRSSAEVMKWLPPSCSYRLLAEGHDLPAWHPLLTGNPDSTRKAGMSVRGHVVREPECPEFDNSKKEKTLMRKTESTSTSVLPVLVFQKRSEAQLLGEAHRQAIRNLVEINTIPADPKLYNKTGFLPKVATMIRAGGDYQTPWTRDASINSWSAASLLIPDVARNTLWAVCERLANGRIIVNRDNQWWDKVIWITAAWNHYAVTGDRVFLKDAYAAGVETLQDCRKSRFDVEFGLFRGPAMMQDGIAGYPEPPFDPANESSFVLDHPASHTMMALSTNCLYYNAFRSLTSMAHTLKKSKAIATHWRREAADLKTAINRSLWSSEKSTYAYFLHGAGDLRGVKAQYQEALGISLSLLFGIPSAEQQKAMLENVLMTRRGIALVDPEFSRNTTTRVGRHSRILWPMAQGYWAHAIARTGDTRRFQTEVESLAGMVRKSDWNFMEIYNPATGKPDGGWQSGKHWDSCKNQTWSATAYLRMIYSGLFGIDFLSDGIAFSPALPSNWGAVCLTGIRYRGAVLDVRLSGAGSTILRVSLDGKALSQAFIPAGLKGKHNLEIILGTSRGRHE